MDFDDNSMDYCEFLEEVDYLPDSAFLGRPRQVRPVGFPGKAIRVDLLKDLTFPGYTASPGARLHDPRSGRLPWVPATASHATRLDKASFYLHNFDYKDVAGFALDTAILANVVCNLRNYHQLSQEETVRLVREVFNPISWEVWSPEAISLAWELVEGFTPTLGVTDEQTPPMRRAALIENEVVDLIAWTVPGGRVRCADLLATFKEWNPDIAATKRELGVAVKAVTGIESKPLHGVRYFVGFHLPSDDELAGRLLAVAA